MFKNAKIKELEISLKHLRADYDALQRRVAAVEEEVEPIRIGKYDYSYFPLGVYSSYDPDPRPKVRLRQALDLIREHLKLTFSRVQAVPERIEVEKIK